MKHISTIATGRGQSWPLASGSVDAVGLEERADSFRKRSIKKTSKIQALYKIIELMDLTTLEGADTPSRVSQLCAKAKHPVPQGTFSLLEREYGAAPLPSVAAVCVYPSLVATAKKALEGTNVAVASVATGFPAGQIPLKQKLEDVTYAVEMGASEIDMVIARGAFLSGEYQRVYDEICAVKQACNTAHLKVILETGELHTYDQIQVASELSIQAGADFIKTSTGKVNPAATLPVTLLMLQVISDHYETTGKLVGMKPAGGIRDAKTAIQYLVMVKETLGTRWIDKKLFRFGASSLLNDVLRQIYKQYTGHYYDSYNFSMD